MDERGRRKERKKESGDGESGDSGSEYRVLSKQFLVRLKLKRTLD